MHDMNLHVEYAYSVATIVVRQLSSRFWRNGKKLREWSIRIIPYIDM